MLEHLEAASVVDGFSPDATQVSSLRALERKIAERNAAFLAELNDAEPEIQVHPDVVAADFVEHRPAAAANGEVDEVARERFPILDASDGITERDPAASRHRVHEETLITRCEHDRFVAEHDEIRRRITRAGDELERASDVIRSGRRRPDLGWPQQTRQREDDQHEHDANRGAQKPWRALVELELPEHLARHAVIRDVPQHQRAEDDERDRADPGRW